MRQPINVMTSRETGHITARKRIQGEGVVNGF